MPLDPHEKLVVTIDDPAALFYLAQKCNNTRKKAKEVAASTNDPDVLRRCVTNLIIASGEFEACFLTSCMDEATKRLEAQAKAAPNN